MRRFVFFCIELLLIYPLFGDFKPGVATAPTLDPKYEIVYGGNEDQKITIRKLLDEGLQEVQIGEIEVSQIFSEGNEGEEKKEKTRTSKIITNFDHPISRHVKFSKEIVRPGRNINNQSSNRFIFIEDIDGCLTTETTSKLQALSEAAQGLLDEYINEQEIKPHSTIRRRKKNAAAKCHPLAGAYCFLQALRQKKIARIQQANIPISAEEKTAIQTVIQNTKDIDQKLQTIETEAAMNVFQQLVEINQKLEKTETALFSSATSEEISQQLQAIEQQLNAIIPMLSNNEQEKWNREIIPELEAFAKVSDAEFNRKIGNQVKNINTALKAILEYQNTTKQHQQERREMVESKQYCDTVDKAKIEYLKAFIPDCVLNTNAIAVYKEENPSWVIDPSPEKSLREDLIFYTRLQIPGSKTKYFCIFFTKRPSSTSERSHHFRLTTTFEVTKKQFENDLKQAKNNENNCRLIYEDYNPLAENPPLVLPPTEKPMIAAQTSPSSRSMQPTATSEQPKEKTEHKNSKQQTTAKRKTPAVKVEHHQSMNSILSPDIVSKIQQSPQNQNSLKIAIEHPDGETHTPTPSHLQPTENSAVTNNTPKPLRQTTLQGNTESKATHKITIQKPTYSSTQASQPTRSPTSASSSVTPANNASTVSVQKRKIDKIQITTSQNAGSTDENSTT